MTTHDEEQLDIIRRLYEKEERQLKEELAQKKAKLKAAQALIRARISVRNRKRRTRCLILIGSYMEHVTQTDLDLKTRLMKGLDGFPGTGSGPGTLRPGPEGGVQMKGGVRAVGREGDLVHDKGYYHSLRRSRKGTFRPYQTP